MNNRANKTITMPTCNFAVGLTPHRLIAVNTRHQTTAISLICINVKPGLKRTRKIPIPSKAKAVLNACENHAERPASVPIIGPMLLSVKKNIPPVFGIAVASSDLDKTVGKINMLAMAYASINEGPAFTKPKAGYTNNPELIIAPDEMQKTSKRPSSFFNFISILFVL